tara:strand:+ start:1373 stop:2428 length:1056 start_codon:yes stop_codon:yes gene_type:complete
MNEIKKNFKNKIVLITGGTGSIGKEIVKEMLKYEPKLVRILSNDEASLFDLQQALEKFKNVRYLIGDIRQKDRLNVAMEGVDYVFHAAALKHVPLCEYNPFEAVNTNVLGSQNVVEAAMANNVKKCICISTDKAVTPTSVLGATKLLAERLFIVANYYKGWKDTTFSVIRFGNVLNSRGSIIPVIKRQIENGGPITITQPEMTRFVMTMPQATNLVFKAAIKSIGGEIFVFKMMALKIMDLIDVMIEELAPKYGYDPEKMEKKIVGTRLGEKSDEELIIKNELEWLYEDNEMFVILMPIERPDDIFRPEIKGMKKAKTLGDSDDLNRYSSNNAKLLNKKEIRELLHSIKVF